MAGTKQFDNFVDLLDFSRASSATVTDSDFLIKRAGHNLLRYSKDFSNSAWIKVNSTVSANSVAAPDGTLTADKLFENSANDRHYIYNPIQSSITADWVGAVFIKDAGDSRYLTVRPSGVGLNVAWATFNPVDGSLFASGGTDLVSTFTEDFGNGWYLVGIKCSADLTGTSDGFNITLNLGNSDELPFYSGDGTSGIYIWGAHLHLADKPMVPNRNQSWVTETTYYPTTDSVYEAPRIDYDPVARVRKGLLVEEQRTNLLTYSEDFGNAGYTKTDVTVNSNTAVAPDGTLTMDEITISNDGLTTQRRIRKYVSLNIGTKYQYTIFAKYKNLQFMLLGAGYVNGPSIVIDLLNGNIVQQNSGAVGTIKALGNNLFKITAEITPPDGSYDDWNINLLNTGSASDYNVFGDGTSGVYIWGAQIEAGAFPSSYIPTTSAQVTRSTDIAKIPLDGFPYREDQGGVWYVEFTPTYPEIDTNQPILARVGNGDDFYIWSTTSGLLSTSLSGIATGQLPITANQPVKVASSIFDGEPLRMAVNGTLATESTSVDLSNLTTQPFRLGGDQLGTIKDIRYYPRRLTDRQLQELTGATPYTYDYVTESASTIIRTPVALGADLVAYSGFSADNYLYQPYNADLDFGTGDFSIMGWIKEAAASDWLIDRMEGRDGSSNLYGFDIFQSGQNIRLSTYENNATTSVISTTSMADDSGTWYFFTALRRNGVLEMYMQGRLEATESGTTRNISYSSNGNPPQMTVGVRSDMSAPWLNGSVALLRISATAPSAEQIAKIYEDEKVLFQDNAKATLYGDSDAVTALAHDDKTNLLHVGTSSGRSVFSGLRRVDNTTNPVEVAISAYDGMIVEE